MFRTGKKGSSETFWKKQKYIFQVNVMDFKMAPNGFGI